MNRKLHRLELLTRFRRLGEDQRRNAVMDVITQQRRMDEELDAARARLSAVDEEHRSVRESGRTIDVERYQRLLAVGELAEEQTRALELKSATLTRLREAKVNELSEAWKQRSAAEQRQERKMREVQHERATDEAADHLDNWMTDKAGDS